MDDLTMWSLVVGFVLPPVLSVLQQPRWPKRLRALLNLLACLAAGAGTAYFQGDLEGRELTSSVLVVLVTAISTYRGVWKPTGIAPAIEAATSPRARVEPQVQVEQEAVMPGGEHG